MALQDLPRASSKLHPSIAGLVTLPTRYPTCPYTVPGHAFLEELRSNNASPLLSGSFAAHDVGKEKWVTGASNAGAVDDDPHMGLTVRRAPRAEWVVPSRLTRAMTKMMVIESDKALHSGNRPPCYITESSGKGTEGTTHSASPTLSQRTAARVVATIQASATVRLLKRRLSTPIISPPSE